MSDVSVCPKTGLAGFGYWCVSQRGNAAGGGVLNAPTKDSFIGEFKAAVNSLVVSLKRGIAKSGDIVLIQLDNKGVVSVINSDDVRKSKRADIQAVKAELVRIIKEYNLVVTARHVKGHTSNKANRSIANKMCDLRAREQLAIARRSI